jgi:hypothetical protein
MTVPQFSDDVVLAALDRAARHSHPDKQDAGSEPITSHLAISTRSGAWRQVRRQLGDLVTRRGGPSGSCGGTRCLSLPTFRVDR